MKFYRPATTSDFIKASKEFNYIPIKARELIKLEYDIKSAINYLYNNYSYSKKQAKEECILYLSFLKAKDDYYLGRFEVYVEY